MIPHAASKRTMVVDVSWYHVHLHKNGAITRKPYEIETELLLIRYYIYPAQGNISSDYDMTHYLSFKDIFSKRRICQK